MDNTYNGWTNYATWRVNLEILDNLTLGDFWEYSDTNPKEVDSYEFSQVLKEYVEDYLIEDTKTGLAIDYALAFISDVNWVEIANHIIESEA